jgi:agmatinase
MAFRPLLSIAPLLALGSTREITFPPVSGYASQQVIPQGLFEVDVTQAKFAGLMTYANLPYVHCLAPEGQDVEPFDIAILGAPFDTVSNTPHPETKIMDRYKRIFVPCVDCQ